MIAAVAHMDEAVMDRTAPCGAHDRGCLTHDPAMEHMIAAMAHINARTHVGPASDFGRGFGSISINEDACERLRRTRRRLLRALAKQGVASKR